MARGLAQLIRNAKQPPDPLTPLIDEYLLKRKFEPDPLPPTKERRRRGGRFGPSGMKCMRAGCFQFMQVPQKSVTSPEQELIFGVGNWTHHMWQAYFKDMERVLGKEKFAFLGHEVWCAVPKFYMAGNLDVHCLINGVPFIIDIKTMRDTTFNGHVFSNQPDPDHIPQITRYMRATGVQMGLLLYINKNDQRYKIFSVPYSKKEWMKTVAWAKGAINHLKRRSVPPMDSECTADSQMRKRCGWAHICYGPETVPLEQLIYDGQPDYRELWEETNN